MADPTEIPDVPLDDEREPVHLPEPEVTSEDLDHEVRELDCGGTLEDDLLAAAQLPAADEPLTSHGPYVLKKLRIAAGVRSNVYDYRRVTSPNGGVIGLKACVHHIPVISNQRGRGDLDVLRRVLINQRLMVQFGTDAEGHVAMYTWANRLCYHARGGNAITCGIEHMHYATSEPWSRKQLRAGAWIAQYLERQYRIPLRMADVEPGPNRTARIVRTGHTSHAQISRMAGYNDRSDPGPGLDYEYVFKAARFFKRHGHFVGV